jgi:hypothetical protein
MPEHAIQMNMPRFVEHHCGSALLLFRILKVQEEDLVRCNQHKLHFLEGSSTVLTLPLDLPLALVFPSVLEYYEPQK